MRLTPKFGLAGLALLWLMVGWSAFGQVISNVYVSAQTATTATIVWTTNIPATSQVIYGLNTGGYYPYSTVTNQTPVTSHSVIMNVLTPGQTYNFAAVSGPTQSAGKLFTMCGGGSQTFIPANGTVNNYYQYGTFTMTWNPPTGSSGSPTVCGQAMPTTAAGGLSGGGSFSASVGDSYKAIPGPGTWTIGVADTGNIAPISITYPLSSQNSDISQQLQAAAAAAGLTACLANTITNATYPSICGGSGGGGSPCTSTAESMQYNNAGAFGCTPLLWDVTSNNFEVLAAGTGFSGDFTLRANGETGIWLCTDPSSDAPSAHCPTTSGGGDIRLYSGTDMILQAQGNINITSEMGNLIFNGVVYTFQGASRIGTLNFDALTLNRTYGFPDVAGNIGVIAGAPVVGGDCAQYDPTGNWLVDAGAPCGSGGGGGLTGQVAGYAVEAASPTTATGPFPMDDAVTTANTITAHKKFAITSATDPSQASFTYNVGHAPTGLAGSPVIAPDTVGNLDLNPNNTAFTALVPLASGFVSGDCGEPTVSGGIWTLVDTGSPCGSGGGGSAFGAITSGTNTTAAMLVGTGASLGPTGTGTIQATNIASTIAAGSNVTITGSGTTSSPYSIASSGGSGGTSNPSTCTASTGTNICLNLAPYYLSPDGILTTTTSGTTAPGTSVTLAAGGCAAAGFDSTTAGASYGHEGVYIAGAGAAGVQYIGTVTSCSGTAMVVTPSTSTSIATGALVQHDETAGFNLFMTNVDAGSTHSGVGWLAPLSAAGTTAVYRVNGLPQNTGTANAIIQLPSVPNYSTQQDVIGIYGFFNEPSGANLGMAPMILTDQTGAVNLFGAYDGAAGGGIPPFTAVNFSMQNLTLQSPTNSGVCMLNMQNAYSFQGWHLLLRTAVPAVPSVTTSCGIKMPLILNNVENQLDDLVAAGFAVNLQLTEHTHAGHISSIWSSQGVVFDNQTNGAAPGSYKGNSVSIDYLWAGFNTCSISGGTQDISLNIQDLDSELATSHDICDPSNHLRGYVSAENPYSPNALSIQGGTNLFVFNQWTATYATQLKAGGGISTSDLTISGITGSTQCLQANSAGLVSGSGSGCGGGSGYPQVTSVVSGTLGANFAGLQMQGGSGTIFPSFFGNVGSTQTLTSLNTYYNGTNWIYINTGSADFQDMSYTGSGGTLLLGLCPSGTAGGTIPIGTTCVNQYGQYSATGQQWFVNPNTSTPSFPSGSTICANPGCTFEVDNTGTVLTPGVKVSVTGTASALPVSLYIPSLATSNFAAFTLGVGGATNNSSVVGFNYAGGTGSASNYGFLGMFAGTDAMHWFPDGHSTLNAVTATNVTDSALSTGLVGNTSGLLGTITALPNATTATTQSGGDATTKVATDAFVAAAVAAASSGAGIVTYSGPSLTLSGTQYLPIGGGGLASTTETNVDLDSPAAATIQNFSVQMSAAPGVGNSVVYTWRKNAAGTALTCTISGASATNCSDTTHSFTVAAADLVDIQAVTTGTIVGTPTVVMGTQFGIAASGSYPVAETHTASGATELDFTSCISSSYQQYDVSFYDMKITGSSAAFGVQFSTNGGSSYDTTSGHYSESRAIAESLGGSTGIFGTSSSSTLFDLIGAAGSATTTATYTGHIYLSNPLGSSVPKESNAKIGLYDSSGPVAFGTDNGYLYTPTTAVNAFRFYASGQTFNGTATCQPLPH